MEEVRKECEEDKLHQFLMGLDETLYGPVKSSLLSRVPLPTLEEAYNRLIQDEESKSLCRLNEERTDAVSFAFKPTHGHALLMIHEAHTKTKCAPTVDGRDTPLRIVTG